MIQGRRQEIKEQFKRRKHTIEFRGEKLLSINGEKLIWSLIWIVCLGSKSFLLVYFTDNQCPWLCYLFC